MFILLKRILILVPVLLFVLGCFSVESESEEEPAPETAWTIMYYGAGDNDLESSMLQDIQEMKNGFANGQGINLIVLFDRPSDNTYETAGFGENFTKARLYRITQSKTWRLAGGSKFPEITKTSNYDANMADPHTLKQFIEFCKFNYPASKYALIISNHGSGFHKKSLPNSSLLNTTKAMCEDSSHDGDMMYTYEMSSILTSAQSVDLFALDACLMSSVEFAYQFRKHSSNTRFTADYMVASAPNLWGLGFDYKNVFMRLQNKTGNNGTADITLGGNEKYYNPATMTALDFAAVIIEEQRDSIEIELAKNYKESDKQLIRSQSLTCLDLSQVYNVKTAVDTLSKKLTGYKATLETIRGKNAAVPLLHYFNASDLDEWANFPFFDLYNLADAVSNNPSLTSVQTEANAVKTAVNNFVVYSFQGGAYSNFTANNSGVHIFFPDGDRAVTSGGNTYTLWNGLHWYQYSPLVWTVKSPGILENGTGAFAGGGLDWCKGGTQSSVIENWFELLESWYE